MENTTQHVAKLISLVRRQDEIRQADLDKITSRKKKTNSLSTKEPIKLVSVRKHNPKSNCKPSFRPPKLFRHQSNNTTFLFRMSVLTHRLTHKLKGAVHSEIQDLSAGNRLTGKPGKIRADRTRKMLLASLAKFSAESTEYDDRLKTIRRETLEFVRNRLNGTPLPPLPYLVSSVKKLEQKNGFDIAVDFIVNPPNLGTLTLTSEGFRAAICDVLGPSASLLFSREDAIIMHKLCDDGDGRLFCDLLLMGDEIYLPAVNDKTKIVKHRCWGGGRNEVGLMKLRSAGFEHELKFEEIPDKIVYEYSKSIVSPPLDWKPDEIKRSFKIPDARLEMKSVGGFRGERV